MGRNGGAKIKWSFVISEELRRERRRRKEMFSNANSSCCSAALCSVKMAKILLVELSERFLFCPISLGTITASKYSSCS